MNRGYCLFRLGRLDEAVAAFDRCLELDPTSASAEGWRRQALAGLDAAHTVTRELVEHSPVTAAAQPALADVTRRASVESQAPKSFATMAIPDTRRGWTAGSVIDGRYEVHATARGGMAVVAIAFDRELWRMVAIKTPLPSMLATADGRARFQREAESWVALGVHPNICCAYYLQEIGGMPRLFIEYVDGGDLTEWLKREEKPGLEEKLDIAIQIASGLDYTNTFPWTDDDGVEHRGLVHRDVKPANVLLTSDGIARVTDFGLVRSHNVVEIESSEDVRDQLDPTLPRAARPQDSVATGSWQTVTAAGGLVGTPPYMAPELWRQAQRGHGRHRRLRLRLPALRGLLRAAAVRHEVGRGVADPRGPPRQPDADAPARHPSGPANARCRHRRPPGGADAVVSRQGRRRPAAVLRRDSEDAGGDVRAGGRQDRTRGRSPNARSCSPTRCRTAAPRS